MKKLFKTSFLIILAFAIIVCLAIGLFFLIPTKTELNVKTLENTISFTSFYDRHNNEMITKTTALLPMKTDNISDLTKKAFIASEDKNFYSHHGFDIPRMIKAALVNISKGEYLQGASTISQQLIKNTQLTNKKTIERKLKEIKLAQKLESAYNKDEILNMYLNTIYFGENRYGIESASRFYFGKSADKLTLGESTLLAAAIKSPSKINPLTDLEKTRQKQSLVLTAMKNCGYINDDDIKAAKEEKITVTAKSDDRSSSYVSAALNEIESLTGLSPYELKNCRIHTGYDDKVQQIIVEREDELDCDRQAMVVDNKTLEVLGYHSTCGEISRFLASTLKPLAVYAPAVENDLITAYTVIEDKKVTIDGYSPDNYNDVYHGFVTARDALKSSLNVPAVKILNMLGTDKATATLKKMDFDISSSSLNLALGYVEKGVTLKTVVGGYAALANYGTYKKPHFINKITNTDGKILYEFKDNGTRVFSPATASIITDMLKECVLSGTGKRLNALDFDVACKTGTSGNENGNTDAYSISYTSDKTVATWLGNDDSSYMNGDVTGGGYATLDNLYILKKLYKDEKPEKFVYKDVRYVDIDKYALENDHVLLSADENTPDKYVVKGLFKDDGKPFDISTAFTRPTVSDCDIKVTGNRIEISFNKPNFYSVKIYRKDEKGKTLVYEGYADEYSDTLPDGKYEYSILPIVKGKLSECAGQEVILPTVAVGNSDERIEPLPDEWWYDEFRITKNSLIREFFALS